MMTAQTCPIQMNRRKYYALCKDTGRVIYRYRNHDFGNGRVDSDETPIWEDDTPPPGRVHSEAELLVLPEVDPNGSHDPNDNLSNVLQRIRERVLDSEVLLIALADPRTYQHSDSEDVLVTALAQKARDYQSAATEALELLADDPEPWKG